MLKYIVKRILIFIPTLIIISLLAFVISLNSPVDPVENLVNASGSETGMTGESSASEELRQEVRKSLGLDLPVFYFSLNAISDCDSIYKYEERSHQENLKSLTRRFGNWKEIEAYYQATKSFATQASSFAVDSTVLKDLGANTVNSAVNLSMLGAISLLEINNPGRIQTKFDSLNDLYARNEFLKDLLPSFKKVEEQFSLMQKNKSTWKNYVPTITFNGWDNQYHVWLAGDLFTSIKRGREGVLRGDFGKSYMDNEEVGSKISKMFPYSFFLVMMAIIIAYIISIPLGVYSAYKKGSAFDNVSTVFVFMLYSLPSFFVGTWLLYKFSNPDSLVWFPTGGVKDPATFNPEWSVFSLERIRHQAPYFVLPLIAYVYSSFAFTSRIMKVSMVDIMGADYIRTARAKGLSEKTVVLKHALRNGLLPIITMFANIFPASIGGSVILEYIFEIPGMGRGVYDAILSIDVPMIVAVFSLTGVLTVIGYLVADILYALVDPRISFSKK